MLHGLRNNYYAFLLQSLDSLVYQHYNQWLWPEYHALNSEWLLSSHHHHLSPPHSSQTLTTYMQSIASYYITPWQSLAANDPFDITVRVCKTDLAGQEICSGFKEVWAIHTEFVPVTRKTINIIIVHISASYLPLCRAQLMFIAHGHRFWNKCKHHSPHWEFPILNRSRLHEHVSECQHLHFNNGRFEKWEWRDLD